MSTYTEDLRKVTTRRLAERNNGEKKYLCLQHTIILWPAL